MVVTATREELEQRIRDLTCDLESSVSPIGDWKVIKCYEAALKGIEPPYDVDELTAARQAVRDEINELQEELNNLPDEPIEVQEEEISETPDETDEVQDETSDTQDEWNDVLFEPIENQEETEGSYDV